MLVRWCILGYREKDEGLVEKNMRKNYNLIDLGFEFFVVNYVLGFCYLDYFYKL